MGPGEGHPAWGSVSSCAEAGSPWGALLGALEKAAPKVTPLLGKPAAALKRNCQTFQHWPRAHANATQAITPATPLPPKPSRLRGQPVQLRAQQAPRTGPSPPHLCMGLEDVVLDAAFGAKLFRTQQAAVLPHQVVSLQGMGSPAQVGPHPNRGGLEEPRSTQDPPPT